MAANGETKVTYVTLTADNEEPQVQLDAAIGLVGKQLEQPGAAGTGA